jgi:hypothetical protein
MSSATAHGSQKICQTLNDIRTIISVPLLICFLWRLKLRELNSNEHHYYQTILLHSSARTHAGATSEVTP